MELQVGQSYTVSEVVEEKKTASQVGSGLLPVYATPAMIALLERAASECLQATLPEGQTSVGTALDIKHLSATPVGMQVKATATVTEIDRRRVSFSIAVEDECGPIGEGGHTRFVVDSQTFLEKTQAKGK